MSPCVLKAHCVPSSPPCLKPHDLSPLPLFFAPSPGTSHLFWRAPRLISRRLDDKSKLCDSLSNFSQEWQHMRRNSTRRTVPATRESRVCQKLAQGTANSGLLTRPCLVNKVWGNTAVPFVYLLPAAVCPYSGTVGAPDRGRGPQSLKGLPSEPSGEAAHPSDCRKALPQSAGQGLHDGCCPSAGFWRLPVVDSGQGEHSEITSRGSRLPLPIHGRQRRPQSSLNTHPRFGK